MAFPPEDCGGLGGYEELADWVHGGYDRAATPMGLSAQEMRDWLPRDWHPDHFSVGETNEAPARLTAQVAGEAAGGDPGVVDRSWAASELCSGLDLAPADCDFAVVWQGHEAVEEAFQVLPAVWSSVPDEGPFGHLADGHKGDGNYVTASRLVRRAA